MPSGSVYVDKRLLRYKITTGVWHYMPCRWPRLLAEAWESVWPGGFPCAEASSFSWQCGPNVLYSIQAILSICLHTSVLHFPPYTPPNHWQIQARFPSSSKFQSCHWFERWDTSKPNLPLSILSRHPRHHLWKISARGKPQWPGAPLKQLPKTSKPCQTGGAKHLATTGRN